MTEEAETKELIRWVTEMIQKADINEEWYKRLLLNLSQHLDELSTG